MKRLMKYVISVAAMSGLIAAPAFAQTEIHVLDVGQGLSVLVESQDIICSTTEETGINQALWYPT